MLEELFSVDLEGRADLSTLRRTANGRLARAFLNRAHDALRAGRTDLARDALRHAYRMSPSLIGMVARDPQIGRSDGDPGPGSGSRRATVHTPGLSEYGRRAYSRLYS